jgi:uncharacterized protein
MIEKVHEYVKSILDDEATGHDYMHAVRVLKNAEKLIVKDVDVEAIRIAALTHDLIDRKVTTSPQDAKRNLEEFLKKFYKSDLIKHVIDIIESISYSKGRTPTSIEGKIVQDADRLEALGAVGIARTFAFGGKHSRNIYHPEKKNDSVSHFYEKLFKLSDLMNTKLGYKIAQERTDFMRMYLDQFYNEIK